MEIEAQEPCKLLRCGQLIDGISDTPHTDWGVLVKGDKIAEVAPWSSLSSHAPPACSLVDLSQYCVMPGFIDCHCHPLLMNENYQLEHMKNSSAYKALYGMRVCQQLLEAGWTTLRVAGDGDVHYAVFEIRRAIQERLFVGPRIVGAGHYISITGGGGDVNFLSPEQCCIPDGKIVDGVEEMRRAVREEVKYGSDWIKLLVSGAFASAHDDPLRVHMSAEELNTAVAEAMRLGKHVMAHAHAPEAIYKAVCAGARSIEHGSFINEAAIAEMKRRGTYLVPTLYVGEHVAQNADPGKGGLAAKELFWLTYKAEGSLKKMVALEKKLRSSNLACVRQAVSSGVRMALGTDYVGWQPVSLNAREFRCMTEVGLTPMQAIKSGTSVAAELLGMSDTIGALQRGKQADIVAVSGDPLQDMSELERVKFVMLGGQVIKS